MNTRDAWNADLDAPRWDDLPRTEQMRLEDFAERVSERDMTEELENDLEMAENRLGEAEEELEDMRRDFDEAEEEIAELTEKLRKLESMQVSATVAP